MLNQMNKVNNGEPPNFSPPQNLKRKLSPDTERDMSRKLQKHLLHAKPKQSDLKYILKDRLI